MIIRDNPADGRKPAKRGRPRVFEGDCERVSIRIPAPIYDRIDGAARRLEVSIPDMIRRAIEQQFRR